MQIMNAALDQSTLAAEEDLATDYVLFPRLSKDALREGVQALNRYSTFVTRDHDFPPAKVRHVHALTESLIFLSHHRKGHVIRGWRSGRSGHAEQPPRRHCLCFMGGQSMQASSRSSNPHCVTRF